MGKLAFLFAGQGAHAPGMGKSLYSQSPAAAQVFNRMEAARPGTKRDCFEGEAARLSQTEVTQPCVYAVDLACAEALREAGICPDGAAGFSLGELAALTLAGAFAPPDGALLVCRRGEAMQRANAENPGAMAAVLRMEDAAVEALCEKHEGVWPVNYNCPGQLVVAGRAEAIPAFVAEVKAAGGRAQQLPVGGAFHTPLMAGAAVKFAAALGKVEPGPLVMPVYANLTARPYDADNIRDTLAAQMQNPVRWHATILQMKADGYDTFIEVGPGKTLSSFMGRIWPEAAMYTVNDAESLAAVVAALKGRGA